MSEDKLPPEVLDALMAGRKLEAIKRLREINGTGLKEAKQAVDQWVAKNPGVIPESKTVSATGCLTWIAGIAIAVFAVWKILGALA